MFPQYCYRNAFFVCFSEKNYSELAFSDAAVMTKGYFQTRKHSQGRFLPSFFLLLSNTTMTASADTIETCRQVLCLHWPLISPGFPGSQLVYGLARTAQKVKAVSVITNNMKVAVSASHLSQTATCWFRACFLIRGQETRGLFSSKEKAKFGEEKFRAVQLLPQEAAWLSGFWIYIYL